MTFILKILGSNSAAPAHNRHQTSQLLNVQNQLYLIDCGEGTQNQLRRFKARISKIHHIFISHLHGDHYLGLLGLILSMHLQGRVKDLHLYAPAALAEIIVIQLKHSRTILNYKIIFNSIDPDHMQIIYENNDLTVETIPLLHRISCTGFLFREKPKLRRINKKKLPTDFPLTHILALKKGEDIFDENGAILYRNRELTLPPKRSRSYAYCSDTIYNEDMVDQIKDVDLLYHESTFLDDQRERARETYHSTALQAGIIARKAKVNMLVLGHYSIRYKELEPLLKEAKEEFLNTILAIEGMDISLDE